MFLVNRQTQPEELIVQQDDSAAQRTVDTKILESASNLFLKRLVTS